MGDKYYYSLILVHTFLSAESLADEPKSANLICPVRSRRTLSGLISLVQKCKFDLENLNIICHEYPEITVCMLINHVL